MSYNLIKLIQESHNVSQIRVSLMYLRVLMPCTTRRYLWLVTLAVIILMPNCWKKYCAKFDIKAGSW